MRSPIQENSILSHYFAPRGRDRLLFLGEQLSQRHLRYDDRLIGFVGDAGSGKSSLIKGMFPGLELANDDDRIDPRKVMQVRDAFDDMPEASTYHIDMRFQTAFIQMHEIVDFVEKALEQGRRVIIEHFNLIYKALNRNADLLIGIGEEIIVTRPSVFGPSPISIYEIVHRTLILRKRAHTVEDITINILDENYGIGKRFFYSADMANGFVLKFTENTTLDIFELEELVKAKLKENLSISYHDENHIMLGDEILHCTGPRLHVRNTSDIKHFSFIKELVYDPKRNMYCLIGLLSDDSDVHVEDLNTIHFLKTRFLDNSNML